MRSYFATLLSLTLPAGAGPNDPAVVIGVTIPPELVAFYAPATVIAAIIYRRDSDDYVFDALVVQGVTEIVVRGTCNSGTVSSGISVGRVALPVYTGAGTFLEGVAIVLGELRVETGAILDTRSGGEIEISAGATLDVIAGATFNVAAKEDVLSGGEIEISSGATLDIVDTGSVFTIDGVSAPRGHRAGARDNANSAAIGAEAVILTCNSFTYKANRAYRILWKTFLGSSVAQTTTSHVRKTNAAGQILDFFQEQVVAGALGRTRTEIGHFTVGGSDVTATLVQTALASAGTVTAAATATNVRFIEIEDCGAAADFPTYPVLV